MISTLFIQVVFWLSSSFFPVTSGLHIKITGIESNQGKIIIGVFKNDGGFPTIGKHFKGYELEIENKKASIFIHDLSKGTYAIGVCHDLNSNGKMDKNFLGIPLEPYGFSKNLRPFLSNPTFKEASFYYNGLMDIEIHVADY